jgi:hypothetical protein
MRDVFPKPQEVHCFVCTLKETLPHRLHLACVRFCLFPIDAVPLLIPKSPDKDQSIRAISDNSKRFFLNFLSAASHNSKL